MATEPLRFLCCCALPGLLVQRALSPAIGRSRQEKFAMRGRARQVAAATAPPDALLHLDVIGSRVKCFAHAA
jgi:hypothetical protein